MSPNIKKTIISTAVYMLAYFTLSLIGLGWVVIVVFIGHLALSLTRYLRSQAKPGETNGGVLGGLRALTTQTPPERRKDVSEEALKARERARKEADCGLTHEERQRFLQIVQNIDEGKS